MILFSVVEEENEKLSEELEEQYHQGMDLVLSGAARRHKGLGFQETNETGQDYVAAGHQCDEHPEPFVVENSEEEKQSLKKSKKDKKDGRDSPQEEKDNDSTEKPKSKPAMFGFVKSSS